MIPVTHFLQRSPSNYLSIAPLTGTSAYEEECFKSKLTEAKISPSSLHVRLMGGSAT